MKYSKAAVIGAGAVIGQAGNIEKVLKQVESTEPKAPDDPAKRIKKLKEELERLVTKRLETNNLDRIVVFIDDLDRLIPVKAVELLEVMKLFLDIPGCVFVLACDYQVVVQGMKEKFGVSEGELKGKSFFDKIIQVPFNMPLNQYKVDTYFSGLLTKLEIDFHNDDIATFIDLVDYSVGFNPRGMKRLFNSLLLLKLVAERKGIIEPF